MGEPSFSISGKRSLVFGPVGTSPIADKVYPKPKTLKTLSLNGRIGLVKRFGAPRKKFQELWLVDFLENLRKYAFHPRRPSFH